MYLGAHLEKNLTNMSSYYSINRHTEYTMAQRNEYALKLQINGRLLSRVIIDQHYKEKHPDMSDKLIIELVKTLNGGEFDIQMQRGPYEYFAVEPVHLDEKVYRLVLLLCIGEDFIGVVNAFRRNKK